MIVVRKLEYVVMNFIFPAVVINFIVCDFLYEYEWVTFGLQFGPLFSVIAFILLVVLLDSRHSEDIEETKADKKAGRNRFIFIIALIVSLNIFWGEPKMSALNITRFEFWLLFIILPLLGKFDYKKRTDNARSEKRTF